MNHILRENRKYRNIFKQNNAWYISWHIEEREKVKYLGIRFVAYAMGRNK